MKKISGIYIIKNLINEKIYVGSSVNIFKRWNEHKAALRNQKHKNRYLQRAWNKFKEENFIFFILEETGSEKSELIKVEQKYLDLYNSYKRNVGYNLSTTSIGPNGIKRVDLKKYNISNKSKIVYQYDLSGNFIKKWKSASNAAIELGFKKYGICNCCNGKLKQSHKYIWKYETIDNEKNINTIDINFFNRKPIQQFDLNGVFIQSWESQRKAAKELNINPSKISSVCNLKRKTAGGYIWKYKN